MTTDGWTDARIDHELVDAFALTGGDVDSPTFRAVYNRMIGLRDDLAAQLAAAQQRIAELEAQTAWEPVPSGKMFGVGNNRIWTYDNGARLTIVGSFPSAMEHVELEDDVRLMRRHQAQEGAE